MSNVICTDGRFEVIAKYKAKLIESTNIETSAEEMAVIDNILFRMWQMGWLDRLEQPTVDAVPVVRCGECLWFAEFCTDFKAKTHCDGMCENPRLDRCVHGEYVLKNWFCADGERRTE